MLKNLAIVQIDSQIHQSPYFLHRRNLNSSTLAGRSLAGKPLVEWLVRRVSEAQQIEGVIVTAEDSTELHSLAEVIPGDIPIYFSSKKDPLARLVDTLREYPAESIIRVSIENPMVDPSLIDRLVITASENPNCDYLCYCTNNGAPALQSSLGLFAEWFKTKALQRAEQETKSESDRFDISRALLGYPDIFQIRMLPVPQQLECEDVRLSICHDEDWEHTLAILDALGAESLDWQQLVHLIQQQPSLKNRMAELNDTTS